MEQSISFEEMPGVIAQISSKLESIESLLTQQKKEEKSQETEAKRLG